MEKDVVKKFVASPYDISGIESGDTNYRTFVALLHLLLVKHKKKKCFVFFTAVASLDKSLKICKKLKLPWKKLKMEYMQEFNLLSATMPEDLVGCIMEVSNELSNWDAVVCSMDESVLEKIARQTQSGESFKRFGHKQLASIEEYPECCAVEFTDVEWEFIETCAEVVGRSNEEVVLDPESKEFVCWMEAELKQSYGYSAKLIADAYFVWLMQFQGGRFQEVSILNQELSEDCNDATAKNRRDKLNAGSETLRKYPFLSYVACKSCLENTKNSPSAIKNKKYSDFCKREFPELHDGIVGELGRTVAAYSKEAQV